MKAKEKIPDVLASRYVSEEMKQNWSMHNKVLLERDFWLAVMHAQKDLGISIPEEALEAYLRVKEEVDLDRIAQREQKLRHDVKARIEEFCELAGHQQIHKGLTSRDLTDNVEQLQILQSLKLVRVKTVAALNKLSRLVEEYKNLVLVARTHNVPAQLSSVGRRLAMFGEEVLLGLEQLDLFIESYPLRGLKGAVGTRLDLLQLFEGKKRAFGAIGPESCGAPRGFPNPACLGSGIPSQSGPSNGSASDADQFGNVEFCQNLEADGRSWTGF